MNPARSYSPARRRGRDRGHAPGGPVRTRGRPLLGPGDRLRRRPPPPRAPATRHRHRPRARRRRATAPRPAATSRPSSGSTPPCSRCSCTRSRRSLPWPRSSSAASAPAAARPRLSCSPRRGWSSCWRGGRGSAGPAGDVAGHRGRRGVRHLHPHLGGSGRARRPSPPERPRMHGRRGHAHPGGSRRRRAAPGRAERRPGFGWLAGIAAVSTVAAIGLFFAGLKLVGPTRASILSTAEPLTAVLLAFAVFGEALGPIQIGGGALVLAGVLVLARRTSNA